MADTFVIDRGSDRLVVTVLDDGTIKSETGAVSGANHQSAEAFLSTITGLTGGPASRVRRGVAHVHDHQHEHDHDHTGGD